MTTTVDFYEVLECDRSADAATLKAAYRKLAMKYHPDKNAGCKDSEGRFKAVSEAYDVLKDPQKRAAYDRFGHAAFQGGGGANGERGGGQEFGGFSDIFESVFGEFMGGQGRGRGPARGADLRYDMEITLEEAYHGKSTPITIDVSALCDTCHGSGAKPGTHASTCRQCNGHGKVRAQQGFFVVERACPVCQGSGQVIADPCGSCRGEGRVEKTKTLDVTIPPGVDEGTRVRMSGEGEAGPRGAPAGDLYIFLHVKRHELFERDGTTLFARAPVSFTTAALGGMLSIPGLDGRTHEVKIPPGIQSGKQLRQRGAGMPVLQGRGLGDLVIQVEVETPTRLSTRQRELLEMFRETETGDECPASKGFFAKLKSVVVGE